MLSTLINVLGICHQGIWVKGTKNQKGMEQMSPADEVLHLILSRSVNTILRKERSIFFGRIDKTLGFKANGLF